MANLDNSNKTLLSGLVQLLRDEVDGWSESSEYNVDNVWPTSPPVDANDELPRGVVDFITGSDFELSIDLDVKLREVTVRIVVFTERPGDAEDLIDNCETAISDKWDATNPDTGNSYTGDWTFRETDGFTPLVEDTDSAEKLRYNRSIDLIFETVKTNN
jgi:hypothetical protein